MPADGRSPATGAGLALSVLTFAFTGAVLGVLSAFLVPTGPRIGVHAGVVTGAPSPGGLSAAAAAAPSNGSILSVGVALAFLGCLGLGLLARRTAGERLVALAPVSAWLIIALLALSEVHGDLVLPTILPGIVYLYAGVLGGALSLLPAGLVRRLRARA